MLVDDPFFNGKGPSRSGCYLCGECLTGCKHGSKNALDKNYLYLARKYGATILPYREVTNIIPQQNGTYVLKVKDNSGRFKKAADIKAKKVVVAAGVLGTLELLFRCKQVTKTLPDISRQLGVVVRTNSESIVGVLPKQEDLDLSHGTTISSDFYPDKFTHITQNRFPEGYSFMKYFSVPLVDDDHPVRRSLKTLGKMIMNPLGIYRTVFAKNWHKRIIVLTVMQNHDNQLSFKHGPSAVFSFLMRRLKSKTVPGKEAPVNIPVANRACAILADVDPGKALQCQQRKPDEYVNNSPYSRRLPHGIFSRQRSYRHITPGFRIRRSLRVDGAAVSANVGVNPALTITALAERAMSLIPDKKSASDGFLRNTPNEEKRRVKSFLLTIQINSTAYFANISGGGNSFFNRLFKDRAIVDISYYILLRLC